MISVSAFKPVDSINFDGLYRSHRQFVRNIVQVYKPKEASMDDVVQDIFLLAWKRLHQLQNPAAVSGWLQVLAKNYCQSLGRQVQRERLSYISIDELNFESLAAEPMTDLKAKVQLEVSVEILKSLLASHKNEQRRQVAYAFYVEHKAVKQIAEEMNMAVSTVLSHLRRFRLIICKAMQRLHDEGMEENLRAAF